MIPRDAIHFLMKTASLMHSSEVAMAMDCIITKLLARIKKPPLKQGLVVVMAS